MIFLVLVLVCSFLMFILRCASCHCRFHANELTSLRPSCFLLHQLLFSFGFTTFQTGRSRGASEVLPDLASDDVVQCHHDQPSGGSDQTLAEETRARQNHWYVALLFYFFYLLLLLLVVEVGKTPIIAIFQYRRFAIGISG